MVRISIICPFYNVSSCLLKRAIESVISQTYSEWELILVDDGSEFDGPRNRIIDSYKIKCGERVTVMKIRHSGPAVARNKGIDAACGELICFLDADDTMDIKMLEELSCIQKKTGADIVMCNFLKITSRGSYLIEHKLGNTILSDTEVINKYMRLFFRNNKGGIASLCNKMYKKSFLDNNNIRMDPQRRRAEDWNFNLDCLTVGSMPLVAVTERPLYNYYSTPGSVSKERRPFAYKQSFQSIKRLRQINDYYCMGEEDSLYSEYICSCFNSLTDSLHLKNKEVRISSIKDLINDCYFQESLRCVRFTELSWFYKQVVRIWRLGFPGCSLTLLYIRGLVK